MEDNFTDKVKAFVSTIPVGEVRTYGQVARACGSPGAARAVGGIMAKNFDPKVPCHRVVRSDGSIGSYNRGGPAAKRRLLKDENVMLKGDRVMLSAKS